jgi:predicted amidohydrolase YtcJ
VSGVKYIVDGTPVERLMFLRQPYSDAPGTRGRLNFEEPELRAFLAHAMSERVQPMFHATGDAAIDVVLGALEATGGEKWLSIRPRIEHGDMLEPGQFARAKRMGVILVQNPSHFMLPDVMQSRLGERRSRTTLVGSALRAGVPLALGSDGPLNPFLNVMFATINAVNPSEALTVEEALVAYTHGSALAEFMEERKGTLTAGKLADLAILSQDIFNVTPPELPKTTSLVTIVGGRVVHDTLARASGGGS